MIQAGDFRNGLTIEFEGDLFSIVDFQHVKPGKGAAFVRVKMSNIRTGGHVEKTFRPSERVKRAHIERKELEYLYEDGNLYHFMDPATYDQIPVNAADIGDALKFIKPNEKVLVLRYEGKVLGIEPPMFVELEVTETEPGHRGDTATNVLKPATVETGAVVNVPIFINIGDIIKVETATGEYNGRA